MERVTNAELGSLYNSLSDADAGRLFFCIDDNRLCLWGGNSFVEINTSKINIKPKTIEELLEDASIPVQDLLNKTTKVELTGIAARLGICLTGCGGQPRYTTELQIATAIRARLVKKS